VAISAASWPLAAMDVCSREKGRRRGFSSGCATSWPHWGAVPDKPACVAMPNPFKPADDGAIAMGSAPPFVQ